MPKTLYTPFRTKYTNRPVERGESGFSPSITQPDCSFSVRELVEQASIASLPSLATLQPWLDDQGYDIDDASQDLRFGGDKAAMLEKFLDANSMRRSIFEKLKERHRKLIADNPDREILPKEVTTIDGIDLEEV